MTMRVTILGSGVIGVASAWYLGQAVQYWEARKCSDPLPFALAEYNAGRRNAIRWATEAGTDAREFVETVSFGTTKAYILDVLRRSRGGL